MEIIIILVIGVLLFGRRLPEVGRYLGKGITDKKKGLHAKDEEPALPPKDADAGKSNIKLGLLGARELRHFRLTFDYRSERLWTQLQTDYPLIAPNGKKADINAKDFVGLTPITRAARDRDLETVYKRLHNSL